MFKKIIPITIYTLLIQQLLYSNSFVETISWTPSVSFVVSFLIIGSLITFLYSFSNSNKVLFLSVSTLMAISIISFLKNQILGVPLLPWDFFAIDETIMITKIILEKNHKILSFIIFLGLIFAIAFLKIPKNNQKYSLKNLTYGFVSLIVFLILILAQNPIHDYLFKEKFKLNTNNNHSLQENGFLISFITLTEKGILLPPSNFSEDRAKSILSQYEYKNELNNDMKPDIVVVMSESLFDPMQLKIKWKKDVLEYSRSLNKRNMNLTKVPTYGGKTANSEFEFLTGNSMSFFGPGSTPYTVLKNQQDSIVKSLNKSGYHSVAIHPGGRTAWDRDIVYPNLGFHEFIDGSQFKKKDNFGNFMSDMNILAELESSLNKTSQPSFHFIVTLQNHMPYDVNPFDLSEMLFDPENMDKNDQVILNYYSKLVERTDQFHKKLIESLSKRKRPTVLLIFGDHLPSLNDNYKILKKYGFVSEEMTANDQLKIHTTPLITWSNLKKKIEFEDKITNCNFLGVSLLEKLHIPLSSYQNFVLKVSKENPNLDMKKIDSFSLMQLIEQYHSLQYLMLSSKENVVEKRL